MVKDHPFKFIFFYISKFPVRHSQATMTAGLLSWEGGAYPCLNLKAWNSRLLLAFFEVILGSLKHRTDLTPALQKELTLASAAATAMISLLDTMETSPRYLLEEQASKMHSACVTFLSLYQLLAVHSLGTQCPRWKATPKFHALLHLCEDQCQSLQNMRAWHCFTDEDYVGIFKQLVLQCPKELLEFRCITRMLLRLRAMH